MAPLGEFLKRINVGDIADKGVGAITGAANTAVGAITTAAAAAPSVVGDATGAIGDATGAIGGAAGDVAGAATNSIEAKLKADLKEFIKDNPWIWAVLAALVFVVLLQMSSFLFDIYHACNCCWHCCKCLIPRRHRHHLEKVHGKDWSGCDPTYYARFCGRLPLNKLGEKGSKMDWKWYGPVRGRIDRAVQSLKGRPDNADRGGDEVDEKDNADPYSGDRSTESFYPEDEPQYAKTGSRFREDMRY